MEDTRGDPEDEVFVADAFIGGDVSAEVYDWCSWEGLVEDAAAELLLLLTLGHSSLKGTEEGCSMKPLVTDRVVTKECKRKRKSSPMAFYGQACESFCRVMQLTSMGPRAVLDLQKCIGGVPRFAYTFLRISV